MDLTSYNTAATDAAGIIAITGAFGMIFLFTAVFGAEYHTLSDISWRGRLIALGGAVSILVGIPLGLMAWQSLTLGDLWEAAFVWKNADTGPFGLAVFAVIMTAFATPVLAIIAFASTMLQRWREQ